MNKRTGLLVLLVGIIILFAAREGHVTKLMITPYTLEEITAAAGIVLVARQGEPFVQPKDEKKGFLEKIGMKKKKKPPSPFEAMGRSMSATLNFKVVHVLKNSTETMLAPEQTIHVLQNPYSEAEDKKYRQEQESGMPMSYRRHYQDSLRPEEKTSILFLRVDPDGLLRFFCSGAHDQEKKAEEIKAHLAKN